MNRADYLQFHENFCNAARELSARKNNDYAGAGGSQPFANFERVEALGVCSTEQGFLVRMTDKLSRISTFAAGGKLQVADESVRDTLIDVVNYATLLAAFIEDKRRSQAAAVELAKVCGCESAKAECDCLSVAPGNPLNESVMPSEVAAAIDAIAPERGCSNCALPVDAPCRSPKCQHTHVPSAIRREE